MAKDNLVLYWMQEEKISPENLLVVSDDLALPFGHLRMRKKGSNGGHNGLLSVEECLNTSAFYWNLNNASSNRNRNISSQLVNAQISLETPRQKWRGVLINQCTEN